VDSEQKRGWKRFHAAAKSRSGVARTEGFGRFSPLTSRCSISSRTTVQRSAYVVSSSSPWQAPP